MHKGILYVVDNYLSDVHLYNTLTNSHIKILTEGKNFSFLSYNNGILYFIHHFKKFSLLAVDVNNGYYYYYLFLKKCYKIYLL